MGARVPPLAGIRSRTTTVPAARSPKRLARLLLNEQNRAGTPSSSQISTTSMSARTSECRKRVDPPSSRTTRSPKAYLPSRPAPAHGLPDQGVAHEDADDEDE